MKKVLKFLDLHLEECVCVVLLLLMTAIIFMQVVFRYASIQSPWTEEVARYMFVWMLYLGCSAAIRYRKHLKIDAVQLLFSDRVNFVLNIISNVVFLVFCILLLINGVDLLHKIGFVQHQLSPAAKIPMIIPYSSWWVCSIIMIIRLVQDTILRFKERKNMMNNIQDESVGKEEL